MHRATELLSTAEFADLLQRDRSTVTRWVQVGRLKAAHRTPGGVLLFNRSDIDKLLSDRSDRGERP